MLIVLGYVLVTEIAVAGIAFLLSVSTDSPLGAVGGAVGLMILSAILDQVTALGPWREILPSHWQFAWLDAVQPQITWGGMLEGASVCACYGIVLLALAFRRFQRKDIVPLYYLAKPGQPTPYDWFPYAALIVVVVAAVYAYLLNSRDPGLAGRVGSIVADE